MGIDRIKHRDYHYTGIYRGTVTYNDDPDVKGKVKIFVHGVYPDEYQAKPQYLPWAEPAMGLFGGNWTNQKPDSHGNHLNSQVGWCTVPHAGLKPDMGAEVYLFFEHGDINFPVYFAAVQAGEGWFSEHPNQHVYRSDNVHIRIDQNTADPRSTTKFDSYNQKNSLLSIQDGTKKQTETRIDIQIQAKQMVAVNLQISGDVNMRQIGDMYIEQEGNRHQTLIGNRYVKHVGNTYIEHEGIYISRQKGQFNQQYIEAQKLTDVIGNVTTKTYGNEYKEVQGDFTTRVGYSYTLFTGRKCNITVTEDMNTQVMKNYILNIVQSADIDITKNCVIDIGRFNQTQTGKLQLTTSNDIEVISKQGGIDFQTLGQFELLNETGGVTSEGYKNLGLKGNITLKSNMGNIAIETVGNKGFQKECMVIPWNPVFLDNVQLISMIISDFDPTKLLFNNNILQINDIGQVLDFIMSLPMMAIYDGLPAFFPVKMILQNPNKEPVKEDVWKNGQYKNYHSVEDNWKDVTNTAYWKVLGRIVGNIDIKSWSGDINIKTEGRLGNAGNINIEANDKVGTLEGYKAGNVNISSNAKRVIYTDPRNLFLDSQNILNRKNIFTNGGPSTPGKLLRYIDVTTQNGTVGCASCVADYLLSLVAAVAPIPKDMLQYYAMGIPLHQYNADIQPNDNWGNPKPIPLFNLGYSHAHAKGNADDFCWFNHGNITINSDNCLYINSQQKYVLNTNLMYGKNDSYHFETTVTPNWKYGDCIWDLNTYTPLDRHGKNLGNTLTLNESFGDKYKISYNHKKTQKLFYVPPSSICIFAENVSTDAHNITYNMTVGNKNVGLSQSYNDNWAYVKLRYIDPNWILRDPLLSPTYPALQVYTEKFNNNNSYKDVNNNFDQTRTKSILQPGIVTVTNNYNEQTSKWNILNQQEISLGGLTIGHSITKDIGCKAISNITTNTQGSMLTQNFEASLIDQQSHKALIMTQQSYDSLIYNVDVKAATENQNYIGCRNIGSNMVTWAVSQLNFTQK